MRLGRRCCTMMIAILSLLLLVLGLVLLLLLLLLLLPGRRKLCYSALSGRFTELLLFQMLLELALQPCSFSMRIYQ